MINHENYINPNYFEILEPLSKWKILSLTDLKDLSHYSKSNASFYKIIRKLEAYKVIDSFIDAGSKEKYVYLDSGARDYFDIDKLDLIPRDRRYHDALSSKIQRVLVEEGYFDNCILDHRLRHNLTRFDHLPDGLLSSKDFNTNFTIGFELELNQKNKERMQKNLSYYVKSTNFTHGLYLFANQNIFNRYITFFKSHFSGEKKVLFAYLKDLKLNNIDFDGAVIFHGDELKKFTDMFSNSSKMTGKLGVNDIPSRLITNFNEVLTN